MSAQKKKGHNWKARQVVKTHRTSTSDLSGLIEDSPNSQSTQGGDTNFVALPSKGALRKGHDADLAASDKKRPKLNQKQKKRLRKVLEAKEKKAKVLSCRQSLSVDCSNRFIKKVPCCVSLSKTLQGVPHMQ